AGRCRAFRMAVIAGGLTIFVLVLGSTTIVSTRNIGVLPTFGRQGGTLSNGLHAKAPWQSVTEMNGTIQIDNHTGEAATTVRPGNNSTAFVDTACAAATPAPTPALSPSPTATSQAFVATSCKTAGGTPLTKCSPIPTRRAGRTG